MLIMSVCEFSVAVESLMLLTETCNRNLWFHSVTVVLFHATTILCVVLSPAAGGSVALITTVAQILVVQQ
jgi:hypothetical protein